MDLKRNKAESCDGVVNEHLIFSDHHLTVHLSLPFTALLRHIFSKRFFVTGLMDYYRSTVEKQTW